MPVDFYHLVITQIDRDIALFVLGDDIVLRANVGNGDLKALKLKCCHQMVHLNFYYMRYY